MNAEELNKRTLELINKSNPRSLDYKGANHNSHSIHPEVQKLINWLNLKPKQQKSKTFLNEDKKDFIKQWRLTHTPQPE